MPLRLDATDQFVEIHIAKHQTSGFALVHILKETKMKRPSLPHAFVTLIFIVLTLAGGETLSAGNGTSVNYSNFRGSAYSVASPDFVPDYYDVVEVYCNNTKFSLRRSIEEAVSDAFAAEWFECVMFSDYSAGRLLGELTKEEKSAIGRKEARDNVEYYINISMGDYSTYTHGGGIAEAEFEFFINTDKRVLSGSIYIEETLENENEESYNTSLNKVLKLAAYLVVTEYVKYLY